MTDTVIPDELNPTKNTENNVSLSKDPQKVRSGSEDMDKHIEEMEKAFHADYDETPDEEFDIEW